MRVAVTGASGFVGGVVTRMLRAAGYRVLPFGRRVPGALARPIEGYESWDICAGMRSLSVDAVVHCAAAVGQWGTRELFWSANVQGTANVVRSTPPSARLVYVSTASVYPPAHSDARVAETASDRARPASVYGQSKLAGEATAMKYQGPVVVLRPHIVYGHGDTTLWPRVAAARRNGSITIPGNGRNRVSVTHVENLAAAVVAALTSREACGVFNVADDETPTVDELLHTMFARHSLPTSIRYVSRTVAWSAAAMAEAYWWIASRPGDPPLTRYAVDGLAHSSVLDTSRARSSLGYVPRWTFRDGPL